MSIPEPKGVSLGPKKLNKRSRGPCQSPDEGTEQPREFIYQSGWSQPFRRMADMQFVVQGLVLPVHSAFLWESVPVQNYVKRSWFSTPRLETEFIGIDVEDMDAFLCQVYQNADRFEKKIATNANGIIRIAVILQCTWIAESVVTYVASRGLDQKNKSKTQRWEKDSFLEKLFYAAYWVKQQIVLYPNLSLSAVIVCGLIYCAKLGLYLFSSSCRVFSEPGHHKSVRNTLLKLGSIFVAFVKFCFRSTVHKNCGTDHRKAHKKHHEH